MAIVNPVLSGSAYQVQLASQPQTTGYTFGQLWRSLLMYNPDIPAPLAQRWVNNAYRRVIDARTWTGLMCKGVLNVPAAYATGSVTVTNGSTAVTGNGTAWTTSMVGQQFRTGFMNPVFTITSVNQSAQTLVLDLPYGNPTQSNMGYMILTMIVSLGAMVKSVLWMVNQQMGYNMKLDVTQQQLDAQDPWRSSFGWSTLLAYREPSPSGQPQWELYPSPNVQQSFPFAVYNQAPDMALDTDYPAMNIRGDVLTYGALSQALRYRGRGTSFYDPAQANFYEGLFKEEMQKMAMNDNLLYQRDYTTRLQSWPGVGSSWWQSHDFPGPWGWE